MLPSKKQLQVITAKQQPYHRHTDGAPTQEFDAARRAEIEQSFAVTRELATQTATFFANKAAEQKDALAQRQAARATAVLLQLL